MVLYFSPTLIKQHNVYIHEDDDDEDEDEKIIFPYLIMGSLLKNYPSFSEKELEDVQKIIVYY